MMPPALRLRHLPPRAGRDPDLAHRQLLQKAILMSPDPAWSLSDIRRAKGPIAPDIHRCVALPARSGRGPGCRFGRPTPQGDVMGLFAGKAPNGLVLAAADLGLTLTPAQPETAPTAVKRAF